MIKAAELRIKELEAQNLVLRNALVHLKHIVSEGKNTVLAMIAVENALETTPKQSLTHIQASGIRDFVNVITGQDRDNTAASIRAGTDLYISQLNAKQERCDKTIDMFGG